MNNRIQQIAMGVTAIAPVGIVLDVLTGTEQTTLQGPPATITT